MKIDNRLELPPLKELIELDEEKFRVKFAGTPIRRLGYSRFLRNTLIAIGNSRDKSLIGPTIKRLDHSSVLVRGMAVWALFKLSNSNFIEEKEKRLQEEEEKRLNEEEEERLKTFNLEKIKRENQIKKEKQLLDKIDQIYKEELDKVEQKKLQQLGEVAKLKEKRIVDEQQEKERQDQIYKEKVRICSLLMSLYALLPYSRR